jgi:hypothetical protein
VRIQLRQRVRQHKSSSPAPTVEAINQLKKGAEVVILSAELVCDKITSLERTDEPASKRKKRKERKERKKRKKRKR